MKNFLLAAIVLFISQISFAQPTGRGRGAEPINGRVYGKIIDDQKSPVEYAIIKVMKKIVISPDSFSYEIVNGALSASNGDFSVDKVPTNVPLVAIVELIGFEKKEIEFTLTRSPGSMVLEKDLGNIRLLQGKLTKEIVIEGETDAFRLEFDKRVYEVDKNPMNAGGTAEDVLRNIPSVQVDIDGNVSMRNASPQIFVDGRPTTLTIDQIPADAIQRIEIITNPSAKFDASGGGGGIINVVMKHNRSTGYNGSIRAGIDKRGRANGGFDINVQEGKLNFFANGNLNIRRSLSTGETTRQDFTTDPNTTLFQSQNNNNNGYFGSGKVGFDWFVDNRNTLTFSQSFTRGQFAPEDYLETTTDTITNEGAFPLSFYYRSSTTERQFENLGSSVLYKHLFAKEGQELTADINFNMINSSYVGDYGNYYSGGFNSIQRQLGSGDQILLTSQLDYQTIFKEKFKVEAGVRGAIRDFASTYSNFNLINDEYVDISALGVNYRFVDQVYAAYTNVARDGEKWKTQFGLRVESSDYKGELLDTNVTFANSFPISLFPSAFITRVLNEKQDVQLAVRRSVNRPSFMQLIPFTDYSDSLNVSRGNPSLKPEFTNSAELSYQYLINKKNTFIATVYYRYTSNTTIRYLSNEYSEILERDVVVSTYANATNSQSSGLEIVLKNNFTKWLELTTNFNLYNSSIDGSNLSEDLTNNVNSYWVKSNMTVKLPKEFIFAASFDYASKKALEVSGGSRGGGGGGFGGGGGGFGRGGFGGTDNTVQGYVEPVYGLDLSIKKNFLKNKNASITFSISDVLRTRITRTYSESEFFVQDTFRRRDPQLWRIQLSWKFGKLDASLFKRKNTKSNSESMEG